jgi:hypothetical protein
MSFIEQKLLHAQLQNTFENNDVHSRFQELQHILKQQIIAVFDHQTELYRAATVISSAYEGLGHDHVSMFEIVFPRDSQHSIGNNIQELRRRYKKGPILFIINKLENTKPYPERFIPVLFENLFDQIMSPAGPVTHSMSIVGNGEISLSSIYGQARNYIVRSPRSNPLKALLD